MSKKLILFCIVLLASTTVWIRQERPPLGTMPQPFLRVHRTDFGKIALNLPQSTYNDRVKSRYLSKVGNESTSYKWLKRKKFPQRYLDLLTIEYCREHKDTYVAVVATRAANKIENITRWINEFGEVIATKSIYLQDEAPRHFIEHLYGDLSEHPHRWIHINEEVDKHLQSRFTDSTQPTIAIVFTCKDEDTVRAAKRHIRNKLNMGTTAIHMTDSHTESLALAKLIFHGPSILHLSKPDIEWCGSFDEWKWLIGLRDMDHYALIPGEQPKLIKLHSRFELSPYEYIYYRGIRVLLPKEGPSNSTVL